MIIAILMVLGLCLGSFVNALVWRIHEQDSKRHPERSASEVEGSRREEQQPAASQRDSSTALGMTSQRLSIFRGRSMCTHCRRELKAKDLIPLLSWLSLKGKCRYCSQSIPVQYPLVEFTTAILFVISYLWWPASLNGAEIAIFVFWLILIPGLMALLLYDLRWFLLPNRILYPLFYVAGAQAVIAIAIADQPANSLLNLILAVTIGGGLFYLLFQVSGGKWIGGGDVKLGFLLGLIAGTPARSLLLIFIAALLGSLVSIPLLASNRLKRTSLVPFGPFLIVAAIFVQLFGADVLNWYHQTFISFQ